MHCNPIIISTLVNRTSFSKTIVDIRCMYYKLYNPLYAACTNLKCIKIKPFFIKAFNKKEAKQLI